MNKTLYIILIVFLSLVTASGIWNFVLGLRIGPEIYKLESYVSWFLVIQITAFTASILLLRYYYDQNYRFAFFTGIIAVVTNLGYAAVLYVLITSGELRSYGNKVPNDKLDPLFQVLAYRLPGFFLSIV